MSIVNKAKEMVQGLVTKLETDEPICGTDEQFVDPDDFSDFSDYDSLMVDSKEGAPE